MKTTTKRQDECPHLVCGLVTAMNADNIIDHRSFEPITGCCSRFFQFLQHRYPIFLRFAALQIDYGVSAFFISLSTALQSYRYNIEHIIAT